jgi:tetratricopeptide (TPR) repeat protein
MMIALLVLCFGLAAKLQPWIQAFEYTHGEARDVFSFVLGGSRRIFANAFFIKADEYYHSGYYPSIFDNNAAFQTAHIAEDTGAVASHNRGDEASFMGPPRDWLDVFSRHFAPNRHTHLDEGGPTGDLGQSDNVQEILPWLKLSAELDPENIKTYIVTAYWLRTRMDEVGEAVQVLRQGLRNNPDDPQLLFELGRVYFESYHNLARARNIWEAALRSWDRRTGNAPLSEKLNLDNKNFDNRFIYEQLQTHLALLEEQAGNVPAAIARWEQAKLASPNPADLQKRIDELQKKMAAPPAAANSPAH